MSKTKRIIPREHIDEILAEVLSITIRFPKVKPGKTTKLSRQDPRIDSTVTRSDSRASFALRMEEIERMLHKGVPLVRKNKSPSRDPGATYYEIEPFILASPTEIKSNNNA